MNERKRVFNRLRGQRNACVKNPPGDREWTKSQSGIRAAQLRGACAPIAQCRSPHRLFQHPQRSVSRRSGCGAGTNLIRRNACVANLRFTRVLRASRRSRRIFRICDRGGGRRRDGSDAVVIRGRMGRRCVRRCSSRSCVVGLVAAGQTDGCSDAQHQQDFSHGFFAVALRSIFARSAPFKNRRCKHRPWCSPRTPLNTRPNAYANRGARWGRRQSLPADPKTQLTSLIPFSSSWSTLS